jgi:predicted transcriptional regulator
VKKTSLYLEPDLDYRVARVASEQGLTKAEYIRRALRAAVGADGQPKITAIAVGEGPGDVADDVDRHLRDTAFGRS